MNKEVEISIIVPIYNAERYIARCAQSLFDQTLDNIEYIFVDDCSSDDGISVLKQVLGNYPARKEQIKIIEHQENKGVAITRNTGLDVAKGKYIGWVDADDWVEPDMFEKLYYKAEVESTDMACCGYFTDFERYTQVILPPASYDKHQYMRALVTGEVQGMLWNKLFRKDLFVKWDICFLEGNNMAEDRNVLFKFLFYANSITYLQHPYYHYVQACQTAMTRDPNPVRIYEEINNDSDVIQFIANNRINFILEEELLCYRFRSKKKLLFTEEMIHLKSWAKIFPDSNRLLWKSNLLFRHKILAFCSLNRWWFFVRLWFFSKNRFS